MNVLFQLKSKSGLVVKEYRDVIESSPRGIDLFGVLAYRYVRKLRQECGGALRDNRDGTIGVTVRIAGGIQRQAHFPASRFAAEDAPATVAGAAGPGAG